MDSPERKEDSLCDRSSFNNEAIVENLTKQLEEIRGMMKDGSSVPEEKLNKLSLGLNDVKARTRENEKFIKCLQLVVASLFDTLRGNQDAAEVARKTTSFRLNEMSDQLMLHASSRDMARTERAVSGVFVAGPQPVASSLRRSSSEGDMTRASAYAAALPRPRFNYDERLTAMLTVHGQLKPAQMMMLLGIWMSKAGSGPQSTEILLRRTRKFLKKFLDSRSRSGSSQEVANYWEEKAKEFLDKPWESLTQLGMNDVLGLITETIPEEEWLTFARNELNMAETDIEQVKRRCLPTKEQLHQLNRQLDDWNRH